MAEHLFSLPTMATEEQAPPPEEQAPTALDDDLPTQSFMELIGPSSAAVSSTSNKNNGQAVAPRLTKSEELAQSQEKAIQTLLDKCAQNNVSINDNLRRAILGEELFNESENKVIRRETFNKRQSLLTELVRSRKESENYDDNENNAAAVDDVELIRELRSKYEILKRQNVSFEVRIKNGSYHVDVPMAQEGKKGGVQHIATVTNAGVVPRMMTAVQNSRKTGSFKTYETKTIVEGINLVLEAGKMYLVLGGPGSGKSTLLKMIANRLPEDKKHVVGGTVLVNGIDRLDKEYYWSKIVSYVDQIDRLHGYLTVKETIEFVFQCTYGGSHKGPFSAEVNDAEMERVYKELDDEHYVVEFIMKALGLKRVEDTFVGGSNIRGVSGGERKRVTAAEMMAARTFVECYDEVSTGLDAATTFDICKLIRAGVKLRTNVVLVSLLQPPPETVALFDGVILVDNGRVMYAGPTEEIVKHFQSLGYQKPHQMDTADWLQSLPTPDGAQYLVDKGAAHLCNEEFVQKYIESERGREMLQALSVPVPKDADQTLRHKWFKKRYANSSLRSLQIVFQREFLLWKRDMYQRKARLFQCLIMGVINGTVFFQVAKRGQEPQSVFGVVFQSTMFVSLGAMNKIAPQVDARGIFYKEQDADFYPTWTFVLGRALASTPSSLQDSLVYGSLIYWLVGFAPTASCYFVFLLLIQLSAFTTSLMFSVFSAIVKERPAAQAAMSMTIVLMVLFSGFTVLPSVIPPYYIWIYWCNIYAWVIRGLLVNQYQSGTGNLDQVVDEATGETLGERVLVSAGFEMNGVAFEYVWVWYTVLFCIGLCILSLVASTVALLRVRFVTGGTLGGTEDTSKDEKRQITDSSLSFQFHCTLESKGATLTFENINYTVKASTSKEELHLLKGISGYFAAGKMTALMGSSGAGKTTLMDVLSLRKTSGEISGDVRVNGHPQESNSFRRVSGYVEQFDTQSPQLTVRETVEFSAKMRLDKSISLEMKLAYVDLILSMLELDPIAGFLVGNDNGGLSFEQRKRLSIAVELASNPSIIFLDEPTSGLDARAASIVMRCMRRIADRGVAVVATIHQPSVAIFNSFDSLLLLKRGGETVFFGELGEDSFNLITYFEGYSSTASIKGGENPATWMLTTIGAGSAGAAGDSFDYAKAYSKSSLAKDCVNEIKSMNSNTTVNSKISMPTKYANSASYQAKEVCKRLWKIYYRSPGYNRVRLLVSAAVALLFGSVFASQRIPENEADMNSRVTSIYITTLFLGINAMVTVLPVFEIERNMFYRHKACLMYDDQAILLAFTVVEAPFIFYAAMIFCLLWYFTVGFAIDAAKFFLYCLFMALSLGNFTYLGQAFMAIFRDAVTAQGMGSLLIMMSSIFAGILIHPQSYPTFWKWAYWVFPLHYVLEGLLTSQFVNDQTPIVAAYPSPFYDFVLNKNCPGYDHLNIPESCDLTGTAEEWIFSTFGGMWVPEHIKYDIIYLVGTIVLAKIVTGYGLKRKNFLAA